MATENDLESLEMECVEEVDDSEEWEDFSEESDDEDGFDRLDLTYADDEGEVGELGEDQDDDEPEPEERVVHARARNPVEAELLPRPYLHEPLPLLGDDDEGGNDGDAPHELDPERLENNNWCLCGGRCQLHPSFVLGDCVCCREIPEVRAEGDVQEVSCITDAASFEAAILDPVSLYIGWNHYTEKWRRQARSFQQRNNEKYRYVAYRQFVRWCWGVLGKDIRVQLPACVQAKIKNSYPDRAGTYKGTILRPLNL